MQRTKIEWCDSTWNPVTGCLHGCEYCYARSIAHRFGGFTELEDTDLDYDKICGSNIVEIEKPLKYLNDKGKIGKSAYPFFFKPTLYRYKLDEPQKWKKGRNIFVCSMADLFGMWVPDDWKIEVLEACKKAPQHNYIFLTKDPIGYYIWDTKKHPGFEDVKACAENMWFEYADNMWLGVTYTGTERLHGHYEEWEVGNGGTTWANFWYLWRMSGNILPTKAHKFISIEPLSCDICEVEDERVEGKLLEHFLLPTWYKSFFEWIIVGAETGKRKDKVIPKREWIEKLLELCKKANIPLFMKDSLKDIWGEPLIQEFPSGLNRRSENK